MSTRCLVIGMGNRLRCDDGVGPWVAARLRGHGLPTVEHGGDGAALIELWQGADRVVIVDATRSGTPPGAIRRFEATVTTLPTATFHASSHLFGLAEAVETARALGRLPPHLVVYGIEGAAFGFGETLSPPVAAAAATVAERIRAELAEDDGKR